MLTYLLGPVKQKSYNDELLPKPNTYERASFFIDKREKDLTPLFHFFLTFYQNYISFSLYSQRMIKSFNKNISAFLRKPAFNLPSTFIPVIVTNVSL